MSWSKRDLYEYGVDQLGGGSGIFSKDFETPIGSMSVVYWKLAKGECTEIRPNEFGVDWPRVYLVGHQMPEDPARVYLDKLIELGGIACLAAVIRSSRERSFADGITEARTQMRAALGLR